MPSSQSDSVHAPLHVLRVDASARVDGSVTRQLADRMLAGLAARVGALDLRRRDVARGLPFVDADWVAPTSPTPTPAARRSGRSWPGRTRWCRR